jgi:hypothetical protein
MAPLRIGNENAAECDRSRLRSGLCFLPRRRGRIHGKERDKAQTDTRASSEASGPWAVQVNRIEQPDVSKLTANLRSCHQRIHRMALFRTQARLQQDCGYSGGPFVNELTFLQGPGRAFRRHALDASTFRACRFRSVCANCALHSPREFVALTRLS